MLYHIIHRPIHSNTTNISNQPKPESVPTQQLMPRYHYSRAIPNSVANTSDSYLIENNTGGHTIQPTMTATTTSNDNNSYGSFKSTFIPFMTNNRSITPTMREFIQIPVTREDGTTIITSNLSRSVPITYVSETGALPSIADKNEANNLNPHFTHFLRPSSKYFQHHFNNINEEPIITTSTSNISRLPSATRRLSLSIPIITTGTSSSTDDDTINQKVLISPIRQIPIRFPQTQSTASTPANNSRISSAVLRSSPIPHTLQRRRTDMGDASSSSSPTTLVTINNPQQSSSDFNMTSSNTFPLRRAEAMAREAIQNIAQQQQQRNNLISGNNNNGTRSPPLSRRVIINLKNNQSVSLDSQISAAMKLPPIPSSSRTTSRNNIFRIPVLHELQTSSHPLLMTSEPSFQSTSATNNINNNMNNGNYKNEFRMEIPVTLTTSSDQENQIQQNNGKEDGFNSDEHRRSTNNNSNPTLKSILKRSSSRDSVSRKNVSFMNA
ncbi:unnamed protein product [Adineta steineri]|uniref:Uncharacterized protein n=1 Tax=Adineta steineri TaxID=433720 RepID=A0A818S160_9BILA|nr:unnamed protein product [Adineta steineri]CAF3666246.1 unnamed protein product [Adineta steineri]